MTARFRMEKRDSSMEEKIKTAQHDNDSTLLEITTSGRKLVIVTVGLPGRGKTYLATKLSAHLTWLGFGCQRFTLSDHRSLVGAESYLDPISDKDTNDILLSKVLNVMSDFLHTKGGQIAILDGSNSTRETRSIIKKFLYASDLSGEILWIEKITNDPDILSANIAGMRRSPGLMGKKHEEVQVIMNDRVKHTETSYMSMRDEDMNDENEGYIKIISYKGGKKKIISFNVDGYLCGRVMFFLQNLRMDHNNRPPIWMSRHGESMHNTKGLLGGNSPLSPKGSVYSGVLADWVEGERAKDTALKGFDVWCSTLKRTVQTASPVATMCRVRITPRKNLDEIESGIYDSYTYEKIKTEAPHEFAARKHDKLRYRYPQGESYLDVIDRLEPIIFELERKRSPVLIIGHQAVLRCLYGYFMDKPIHTLPHNPMPLHTVIKLMPGAYGCEEERFDLETKVVKRHTELRANQSKL